LICIACGYENQAGNRFCGMCGLPLPHRPLTAPGAVGTHSFTRVPVEAVKTAESQPPAAKSSATAEIPSAESRGREPSRPEKFGSSALGMVPEVPLDEYVKNFRYIPPSDPEEVTMRGDAHVSQAEARVATDPVAPAPKEPVGAAKMDGTSPSPPPEDVGDRLGLEPMEERNPAPRFRDIDGLPPPHTPPTRASGRVGTSILGLNDTPQISTESGDPVEVIRTRIQQDSPGPFGRSVRSRRVWLTAAIVLVVVGSGFLEWRSLVQTGDRPVAVIKLKIQEFWRDIQGGPTEVKTAPTVGPAENVTKSATDIAARSNTGSEEPLQSPQPPPAVDSTANPPSHENEPPPPLTPHAAVPSATSLNASVPSAGVPNAKSPNTAAKQPVPGADEVAKANNASDSAAAAAWLWKATAKGNPEAPIRLADRYIKGDGVPRSCEQALVLLKTAATKENAGARNRLAALYRSGTCVQRNRVEAYRWVSSALAADPNSNWAQENRELLWQEMTADERAAAQRYR